jgi:hypothetical protein
MNIECLQETVNALVTEGATNLKFKIKNNHLLSYISNEFEMSDIEMVGTDIIFTIRVDDDCLAILNRCAEQDAADKI